MFLPLWLVIVIFLVSACASSPPPPVVGEGSDRFPSETLTEWVSFADQISVVSVLSERDISPPADVLQRGEGYIGRIIAVDVEKTLWRRSEAPAVDATFSTITEGWVLEGGTRHPFALAGGPRLEVGGRYLMPLVRAPRDGVEWSALSAGATIPLDGGTLATTKVFGKPSTIAEALKGQSLDDLALRLASTSPDPVAKAYWDLAPDARVRAVLNAED